MTHEYKIDIRIKNNLIYKRIMDAGFKSISDFCRNFNLCITNVNEIINMKKSVIKNNGDWIDIVKKISEALNVLPEDIITKEQGKIINNKKIEIFSNHEQLTSMLTHREEMLSIEHVENDIDNITIQKHINNSLDTLCQREKSVLEQRYGLNGFEIKTLEELANAFGVTRERIRQIEHKALRKLRHPKLSENLEQFI